LAALHNGAHLLRQYLQLVRLPNVFTALSNVLAGYFSLTALAGASVFDVSMLMGSSALLYVSGIVFNDYFDIEIDRKERPSRPLPSGRVSRQGALTLAVSTLAAANVISFLVSPASLAVSAALSAVVLAYDYRAKHGRLGPAAMGGARFLNVVLGASPALLAVSGLPWHTLFAAGAMFSYVYAITLLSRKEAGEHRDARKSVVQSFSIITGITASTILLAVYLGSLETLVSITIFAAAMLLTLKTVHNNAQKIQGAVRNLVLSIIILDSIFITVYAGLPYGLATLAITIPPIILARRMYVT
jgi:4-hydroxybenzoate polyprenyltransferase